jgi:hypothetical protein
MGLRFPSVDSSNPAWYGTHHSHTSQHMQTATEHSIHSRETQHGGIRTPG